MNYAHAKILGLLLAYQSPRDFVTGQAIDIPHALAWQNAKEFHHFFPQAYLKSIGVSTSKASALANMVYLSSASNKAISDRAPADYLKELLAKNEQQTREWLATNLIENDAINAALANDYAAFLGARSETIDREARRLAGW